MTLKMANLMADGGLAYPSYWCFPRACNRFADKSSAKRVSDILSEGYREIFSRKYKHACRLRKGERWEEVKLQ